MNHSGIARILRAATVTTALAVTAVVAVPATAGAAAAPASTVTGQVAAQGETVVVDGVLNFRDAGGLPTRDGKRLRQGVLYRSGQLDEVTDDGLRTLSDLGLTSVIDFRTEAQRAEHPDRLPPAVAYLPLPVEAGGELQSFADLLAMTPEEQEALLGDGKARQMMIDSSRDFVTDPGKRAQFATALHEIANGDGATLVHCTGGRDRTGVMTAIVQGLLGVSRDDVIADYLRSNTELAGWKASVLAQLEAAGMENPQFVEPLLEVDAAYLEASADAAIDTYGSLWAFARDGLNVDSATLGKLRDRLLE
ncbi:tyrosine-protein phosphatase [Streptomyces sp. WMMC897]|uniref:tyrosine-protein phosphatase n=1 Tax=Streptomyces sp. WMMC897 TaxID=3014782 RepID=UPI0022B6ECED|nr:tyrosine-protein phosphatase [Streptomyces sp. WMMC897]MCZ7416004.1 tyrosine-protein phosphatase [Streptomyces sp. WMMC897]